MELNGTKKSHKSRTEYHCEKCAYITVRKVDYDKHILTAQHQSELNGTKNSHKSRTEYRCEKCNYITVRKNDYDKHILTAKHLMEMSEHKTNFECDNCNKIYQTSAGLWKHNKKCLTNKIITPSKDELIMTLVKQNVQAAEKAEEQSKRAAEQVAALHEKIIELCKNGVVNNTINNNNSNNKSFNLNFFLNETCKDAMNLTDFAKSVVLQLSDIDKIGEVGYVNGMTNIIASHLNSLAVNKRPIHCTDLKRETIYVKDEDKWEKDENQKKIRLLIRKMDRMLGPLMVTYTTKFMKEYHSDVEYNKYNDIGKEVIGGKNEESVNVNNIIRNISKNTVINR